jgi:methylated-DNA-[protein]-cysteine S-methyltransferase
MLLEGPRQPCVVDRLTSPAGDLVLVVDESEQVRSLDWADRVPRIRVRMKPTAAEPPLVLRPGRAPAAVRDAFHAYFAGEIGRLESLKVAVAGTPFQRAVWAALRDIPPGTTVSYGEIARRVGAAGGTLAARAVGVANRENPVALVIPCHRVVGASGALTGYAGGIQRKRWLLAHEASASGGEGAAAEAPPR